MWSSLKKEIKGNFLKIETKIDTKHTKKYGVQQKHFHKGHLL